MDFILIILSVLICVCLYKLIKWYQQQIYFNKCIEHYPGPKPTFIVGNGLEFSSTTDILPALSRLQKEHGSIYKLVMGPIATLLIVTDPKLLEFVLSSNKLLHKTLDYSFYVNWLGNGLLTSEPIRWRKHRKIITPTFHFKILENFADIFDAQSKILVKYLGEDKNEFIDISQYVSLCTMDIICETAMGIKMNVQLDQNHEYKEAIDYLCKILIQRVFSPWKQIESLYRLTSTYKKELETCKLIHDVTDNVIKERKESLKHKKHEDEFVEEKSKMMFLDMLLESSVSRGGSLTDQDIREEVDTFMFEGHDTTASSINFALYCLANNQKVQEKVVQEIIDTVGTDKNVKITQKNVQDMKYFEMVIKESERIFPPAFYILREIHEDTEYQGTILPKGLRLGVYIYGLHRNPDIYEDPEKFDPERFTPENQSKRPNYSYLPFSAGPRNCVGQKFAMVETKVVVANVLMNYVLYPDPNHKVKLAAETVLRSANGIMIKIKPRIFK